MCPRHPLYCTGESKKISNAILLLAFHSRQRNTADIDDFLFQPFQLTACQKSVTYRLQRCTRGGPQGVFSVLLYSLTTILTSLLLLNWEIESRQNHSFLKLQGHTVQNHLNLQDVWHAQEHSLVCLVLYMCIFKQLDIFRIHLAAIRLLALLLHYYD